MSIFKVKPWWSNEKDDDGNYLKGTQNGNCLKVDKFISYNDSDCIVIGSGSLLKVYKPSNTEESHTLLEVQLSEGILHIETGKFIVGSVDRQILVLHPRSYEIFQLNKKEGHTDAGDQHLLTRLMQHAFTRKAYTLICGNFGNVKTRDFICVQGLDGSLSFFDQDTFLFLCEFDDVIIPGPVAYIPNCDSFVICKSTWMLEISTYQQLRELGDLNARQNKKAPLQWIYNAGEEIFQIQVIQTSNNFSTILALGERHLYCFQDNGLMKFMIKFNFNPTCFNAYLIGWYYEPGARLLVMVASDESKLFIYENTRMLWSCDLLNTAISISRCFLKSLPGGLVTLSTNGVTSVSYIGTEPDLNANGNPMINETVDPVQVQEDLEAAEESLQKILESKDTTPYPISEIIKIRADVGKPTQSLFQEFTEDCSNALHLLTCPVVVILNCEEPKLIQSVQITYVCSFPFASSDSTKCLDAINGTEIVETQVFLASAADVADAHVKLLFTITDSSGRIALMSWKVFLPLSLYCKPTDLITDNIVRIEIIYENESVNLEDIFTDFSKEELEKHGNSSKATTLMFRSSRKTVTVTVTDNIISVAANDFTEMATIFDHLLTKLKLAGKNEKEILVRIKLNPDIIKKIIHKFLKSIEGHAKERIKLKQFEDELNTLQRQFTLVQKRLLVQYGSQPPGNCDDMEFLMKDTHSRIVNCVHEVILYREIVCRSGIELTAVGHLIILILKETVLDDFKVKLIEEMLSLNSLYEEYQEWEEAVTQALTYISKTVFNKTNKDMEKLTTVTEQGVLSHTSFKRFLKQLKAVLENMFSEANIQSEQSFETLKENKIIRIEEFVEVI